MKNILFLSGLALCTAIMLSACNPNKSKPDSNHPEGIAPPIPKNATVQLQNPPAPPVETSTTLNLQDTTRFLFQITKGREGLTKSSGKVTALNATNMTIKLNDGRDLEMAYQLPGKGRRLLLDVGQEIEVNMMEMETGASISRAFALNSAKKPVVASGRMSGIKPIEINVSESLKILQMPYSEKQIIIDSEIDRHFYAQIVVVSSGKQLKTKENANVFNFTDGKDAYELRILSNGYGQAKKGHEPASEGDGYYLEYWLLKVR